MARRGRGSTSPFTATLLKVVQKIICVWLWSVVNEKGSMKKDQQKALLFDLYHKDHHFKEKDKRVNHIPGHTLLTDQTSTPFAAAACFMGVEGGVVTPATFFSIPSLSKINVGALTTPGTARGSLRPIQRATLKDEKKQISGETIHSNAMALLKELKILESFYNVSFVLCCAWLSWARLLLSTHPLSLPFSAPLSILSPSPSSPPLIFSSPFGHTGLQEGRQLPIWKGTG